MQLVRLIDYYIAKNFLLRFGQVCLGFSAIIFFINFIDAFDKIKGSEAPFYIALIMAFLRIPEFLNDVVPSLVLIAAIITFFSLSSRSEITIMRVGGYFIWQVMKPVMIMSFALGVFWVTVLGPLSIAMNEKFNRLESRYVNHEMREAVELTHGVWIKQDNLEKPNEEIIIRGEKIYRGTNEIGGVTVWFIDAQGQYYRRLDAQALVMQQDFLLLQNVVENDAQHLGETTKALLIPSNLDVDFVFNKLVSNFQNVKSFSVFTLPKLIKELQDSGFQSRKFEVYFQSLLSLPFFFLAMSLISCYFGLNHIRNNNAMIIVFIGIASGLVIYIVSSVMRSFGSSGLISIFASTWIITGICLAVGILLIYRKEKLS